MSEAAPQPGIGYDIELVFRISGLLGADDDALGRLAVNAERLKGLAKKMLAGKFGRSPVLVSAALGLASSRPSRKTSRRASLGAGPTKKDLILKLLEQDGGAAMADLRIPTGWRSSTVSAQLTYLSKLGHNIERESVIGVLRYHLQK